MSSTRPAPPDSPSWTSRAGRRHQQRQLELPIPPRGRGDASALQAGPVGSHGLLFDSGKRSQLTARYHARSVQPALRPDQAQSSRTVRPSGCDPRFPNFQSPYERGWRLSECLDQGHRISCQRQRDLVGPGSRAATGPSPRGWRGGQGRHAVRPPRVLTSRASAPYRPHPAAQVRRSRRSPECGVQRHVIEEAAVLCRSIAAVPVGTRVDPMSRIKIAARPESRSNDAPTRA